MLANKENNIIKFMCFSFRNEYVKNVLTVITGNGIAQIVPLIVLPILTRIYTPKDFGFFSVFIGSTSIISVIATGRYELAINLPKKDQEAFNLCVISLSLSFIFCFLLMFFIFMYFNFFSFLGLEKEKNYLFYFVPLSVFLLSFDQILCCWNNRKKYFRRTSLNRILQSGFIGGGQIGFSTFLNWQSYGLIVGDVLGRTLSTLWLFISIIKNEKHKFSHCNMPSLMAVAKRYQNFPRYLIIAHGINISSSYFPIFFLEMFFDANIVGFFALANRVLRAPLVLMSTSISTVFRQKASEQYARTGNCLSSYKTTLTCLVLVAFFVFLPLFFVCPLFFVFLFGENWKEAGEYAKIMIPMLAFDFVASPLSAMFMISEKQRLDLLFQIVLFTGISLSFYISSYSGNPKVAIVVFSAIVCAWQATNIYFTYSFAKGTLRKHGDVMEKMGEENKINCS